MSSVTAATPEALAQAYQAGYQAGLVQPGSTPALPSQPKGDLAGRIAVPIPESRLTKEDILKKYQGQNQCCYVAGVLGGLLVGMVCLIFAVAPESTESEEEFQSSQPAFATFSALGFLTLILTIGLIIKRSMQMHREIRALEGPSSTTPLLKKDKQNDHV